MDMAKLLGILNDLQQQISKTGAEEVRSDATAKCTPEVEPRDPARLALALCSEAPPDLAPATHEDAADEQQETQADVEEIARLEKLVRKEAKRKALEKLHAEEASAERPIATPVRSLHDGAPGKPDASADKPVPILKIRSPDPRTPSCPSHVATSDLSHTAASSPSTLPADLSSPESKPTVSIELPVNSTTHKKEYMRLEPWLLRIGKGVGAWTGSGKGVGIWKVVGFWCLYLA